jgi:2-dehydro-3-deoxyphosphooctonate aldolase (KDO 8-P synthase)
MTGDAVDCGGVSIGGGGALVLIAGPCVIESASHTLKMAERLSAVTRKLGVPLIFKASYDKANRSSVNGFRGPGLDAGLEVLARVRREFGLPVLSDVHEVAHVQPAAEVLDVLQIPAFLCRQTDLLLAAGATGKPVNVKKGQFTAPGDMRNVIEKIRSTGNGNTLLTERGTTFGYNNLVVDFRGLAIMRSLGQPVVFDATHSVQLPGGAGTASGGQAEFIPTLARAAVATGVDGLFVEVHDNPAEAKCDGPNALALDQVEDLLTGLLRIRDAVRPG